MTTPTAMDDPAEIAAKALTPTRPLAFIRSVGGPTWIRVGIAVYSRPWPAP